MVEFQWETLRKKFLAKEYIYELSEFSIFLEFLAKYWRFRHGEADVFYKAEDLKAKKRERTVAVFIFGAANIC